MDDAEDDVFVQRAASICNKAMGESDEAGVYVSKPIILILVWRVRIYKTIKTDDDIVS